MNNSELEMSSHVSNLVQLGTDSKLEDGKSKLEIGK
jgi:hypothetical protein